MDRQAAPRGRERGRSRERRRTPSVLARTPAFVWATLVSFFAVLGAVLVLNTVVDPFALAGTDLLPPAVEDDRSTKLTLIDRLEEPPGILILGSSRARQAEPAYLQRLTGRSGFNAAVTGGGASDAWVMTNHVARRFPHERRGYVWFVDVGIAGLGVNPLLAATREPSRTSPPSTALGLTTSVRTSARMPLVRRCESFRAASFVPAGQSTCPSSCPTARSKHARCGICPSTTTHSDSRTRWKDSCRTSGRTRLGRGGSCPGATSTSRGHSRS